jgi:NAD(P)-dependent dehydrogenase (short-subunit alcohol dehydrogenase family)
MTVLFTKELAKRLADKNIKVVALHPGIIYTNIVKAYSPNPIKHFIYNFIMDSIFFIFGTSAEEGAKTTIFCVIDQSIESGEYYDNCKVGKANKLAEDKVLIQELWDKSLKLAKVEDI